VPSSIIALVVSVDCKSYEFFEVFEFDCVILLTVALWHGVDQEHFLGGKGGRCVGLTTLPPSCVDCLKIWELQPPETLRVCRGL
jgi:hypothetical protein